MLINIQDPIVQTWVFTGLLLIAIVVTFRRSKQSFNLDIPQTQQLKGLAILMVLISHIGYFLFTDHRFLFPISVLAGVGVDIFLFLSGFGLTLSDLKHDYPILSFYKKRLMKIFLPMWIVLVVFYSLDWLVLHKTYSSSIVFFSFVGFFPVADIFDSLNSPLWYFTFILFYYLVFPIIFFKKHPWVSALILLGLSILLVNLNLPVKYDVLKLYKTHNWIFPMGMFFALILNDYIAPFLTSQKSLVKAVLMLILAFIVGYTAIYSGVGKDPWIEQGVSVVTMLALIFFVLLNPFQSRFLNWLGVYSYEIYLIQWPILLRYDFIYKYLPAGIGTFLYIVFFLAVGYLMQKLLDLF